MASAFEFVLNGRRVQVERTAANSSLLSWLRNAGHTGSKEGCAEGDCGACTVAFVDTNAHGERTYRAVNSCITLLPMVAGREIVTVEGVAPEPGTLHPVQEAMVAAYGSQCGFCTPGFVVSMFEGYYRSDLTTREQIGDQLNGNLCRCTGYRPIREAMEDAIAKRSPQKDDLFQLRLKKNTGAIPALTYESDEGQTFLRPTSLAELLALKAEHREKAELVAGATEIGVYINKAHRRYALLVSTEGVRELSTVEKTDVAYVIGGGATLTAIEEALGGEYPMIDKMLWVFAARQIRNRATLAGNIVTASPIGDMPPLMLALDAAVVLEKKGSSRTVPLADFFVAYRKTVLEPDEIVRSIVLPRLGAPASLGAARRLMDSYKVSKRRELDISIAAAAFVIELDASAVVRRARLAYGGVAATPVRARRAEAFLVGKAWTEETMRATQRRAGQRARAHRRSSLRRRVPPRAGHEPVREILPRRDERRAGSPAPLRARGGEQRARRREPEPLPRERRRPRHGRRALRRRHRAPPRHARDLAGHQPPRARHHRLHRHRRGRAASPASRACSSRRTCPA